jgi:DNA-binding CsgD family transcriptional regulator
MELLTNQEKLIFKERSKGVSNASIARKLNVSPAYISKTLKNIREKITTVDSTLALLKETGYIDDTRSLPVTANTIEKLKNLPTPKLPKSRQTIKPRRRRYVSSIATFDEFSRFMRVAIGEITYPHPIPNDYHRNEIPMSELMITR